MKLQEKKNWFLLYKSQYAAIKDFTPIQKWKLLEKIFEYQLGNEDFLTDDGEVELAFKFFKIQFDFDWEKYQEFLEKQRQNGQKGWRKRIENLRKNNPKNPEQPTAWKSSHNENDNEKEKVKKKLPKAIVSKKPKKVLKAKKVVWSGIKSGFWDPAINEIVETIKEHHKVIDGTQNEARTYGKMLRDKIEKIPWFTWDYRGFIDDLITNASKFTKQYTTSPKNIYYNLAKIMAWSDTPQFESKIKTPPRRVQEQKQKDDDKRDMAESEKKVEEKSMLKDYWDWLTIEEKGNVMSEAMKNAKTNNPNIKDEFLQPMIVNERNKILKQKMAK